MGAREQLRVFGDEDPEEALHWSWLVLGWWCDKQAFVDVDRVSIFALDIELFNEVVAASPALTAVVHPPARQVVHPINDSLARVIGEMAREAAEARLEAEMRMDMLAPTAFGW